MSGSPFGVLEFFGSQSAADTQAQATTQAAGTSLQGTREAIASQERMYNQARADIAPWRDEGEKALNALVGMVDAGPGDFEASPSYDFVRSEGLNAMNQTMAGMGLKRSGVHAKAAGDYATDLASQEYDNFLRRYYQSLTPHQSLAGVGMTAGQGMGANAMATGAGIAGLQQAGGNNLANLAIMGGNAQAAGILGGVNAIGGAMGDAGRGIANYAMYNNAQNALGAGGGGAGSMYGYGGYGGLGIGNPSSYSGGGGNGLASILSFI